MIYYFGQLIPGERASGAPSWEGGVLVFCGCCNRWSKTESLETIHVHYFTRYTDLKFSVGLMWVTVKASAGQCTFSQLQGRIHCRLPLPLWSPPSICKSSRGGEAVFSLLLTVLGLRCCEAFLWMECVGSSPRALLWPRSTASRHPGFRSVARGSALAIPGL